MEQDMDAAAAMGIRLQVIAGSPDEMKAKLEALHIEWHPGCDGRHGVVRCQSVHAMNAAYQVLAYFYGDKCAWRSRTNLEFVPMTKVFPPPTRPWGWCGTTVLFADWKAREQAQQAAAAQFRLGDRVTFTHRGIAHIGMVSGVGRTGKLAVIVGHDKWYVPAMDARRLQGG